MMKRLSNKIMDMERRSLIGDHMYNIGHDDAKHEAACMAIAYDDLITYMRDALQASVDCGLIPKSSAKDGGAARHAKQTQVADQVREALAKARNLDEHQKSEGVE